MGRGITVLAAPAMATQLVTVIIIIIIIKDKISLMRVVTMMNDDFNSNDYKIHKIYAYYIILCSYQSTFFITFMDIYF